MKRATEIDDWDTKSPKRKKRISKENQLKKKLVAPERLGSEKLPWGQE